MKLCLITGSRADWGLLEPLAQRIKDDPDLELQLIATGSHLSPHHGMTINNIGFDINETIEILLASDTPVGVSKSVGLAVISFAEAYHRLRPNYICVLGDRFEILAATISAYIAGIPIFHIHGGELSQGSVDEGFRHSITKMSSLHFVANDEYRRRVIQLGEQPGTVYNVGALGLEGV